MKYVCRNFKQLDGGGVELDLLVKDEAVMEIANDGVLSALRRALELHVQKPARKQKSKKTKQKRSRRKRPNSSLKSM